MANAGHGQSLLAGGGGEKCPSAAEEDPLQIALVEFVQKFAAEGNGTASTTGATGMNILSNLIEHQSAAIGELSAQR